MRLPNNILIIGGTGALGTVLVQRILQADTLDSKLITVFSRDEAKHHKLSTTIGYPAMHQVKSWIGDVRDYSALKDCIEKTCPGLIINCAAMKQVPLCEEFVYEAVQTNVIGTQNIKRVIDELDYYCSLVTISTDKAVKPINAYGHTKALQEKLTLNGHSPSCVVRYGNVLESTGSVIPFFRQLLSEGKSLPITHADMTRFLLSLDDAVDLIFSSVSHDACISYNKSILIPKLHSCKITDLANLLIEDYGSGNCHFTEPRPGEKLHEVLVAENETDRIWSPPSCNHYVIGRVSGGKPMEEECFYSNHSSVLLEKDKLRSFLQDK